MNKHTAYCGLNCAECPAFTASVNNDDELRKKTAEEWKSDWNPNIKPEDINCLGCKNTKGVFFAWCFECEIRKCGKEKSVETCAHCDDYPCEKVNKMIEVVPSAKNTLEKIRVEINKN